MLRRLGIYAVILTTSAALVHAEPRVPAADYYVSPMGNDAWSGKLDAANADGTDGPFASVQRARDALRETKAEKPGKRTVLVRGGYYFMDEPLMFEPQDSGTPDAPVIYTAYLNEVPILSGGKRITGFEPADDGTLTVEIPEVKSGDWYFHQLFVNGRRRQRARTPNEGYLHIEGFLPGIENPNKERDNPETRIGFRFRPGDIKAWDNLSDVNLFVYHSWTSSLHWIDSIDEQERLVRFTAPSNWPIGYWDRNVRYHLENYREALDTPGEWYLDRSTGVLHYKPIGNENKHRVGVFAPRLRKLVEFKGDPDKGAFVAHIQLKNLTFAHATWFIADKGEADGQAAAWLEAAVFARGANDVLIEDCELAHVGEYGVYFERGCKRNTIRRCYIHDIGAGGVRIGHMSGPGDENTSTSHNVVENSLIHHGGHVFPAGVGVWIGRSSHNRIAHNEISDFLYTGISVGWNWGYAPSAANHNIVEYNKVHQIGQGVLSDMGGIYTLGVSPGTVIRNNIFANIQSYIYGGWGLYTDEGSSEIVMENNIVYNTKTGGFHQHYGKDNIIRNNVLAYALESQLQRTREEEHNSFTFENNIVLFDNGNLLGSNWKNEKFRMDKNVYWDTSSPEITFAGASFDEWKSRGHDVHSVIADPKFVDPAERDFRLQPDSPAIKMGFKPIDAGEIGLTGSEHWTSLPSRVHRRAWKRPEPAETK